MVDIVTTENPVLRELAREIPQDEISSAKMQNILKDMSSALSKESHGVALAAPQIGLSLQIFIIAGFVLARQKNEDYDKNIHKDEVFINPKIVKSSKKTITGDEGCLSVPGKYSWSVKRPEKVQISYFNELGEMKNRGASGFLARVFQHEIDHLHGKLYTDIADTVDEVDENFKKIK